MENTNPSQDLLAFYKNQSLDFSKDIKDLSEKIDTVQKNCICQLNFWEQIKEKNDEIFELQAMINKIEICFIKEKDNNLRLVSENDELRIKNIENKQRIREFETILFDNDNSSSIKKVITNGTAKHEDPKLVNVNNKNSQNIESLKVKSLKLQIGEQRKFISQKLEIIIENNKENEKNIQFLAKKEASKQRNLIKRLTSTQELLCQTAKDLAELKNIYHKNEEIYKLKEITLRNTIIELRSQLCHLQGSYNKPAIKSNNFHTGSYSTDNLLMEKKGERLVDKKLKVSQDSCKHYKEKLLQLENDYDILREKFAAEHQLYSERNEALTQKLKVSEVKHENLLKKRNFDKQGYQADINILRDKVKQLEKLLYRATITLGNESKNQELFQHMEQIAAESKKLLLDEKDSRLQLLELEDKLKERLSNLTNKG